LQDLELALNIMRVTVRAEDDAAIVRTAVKADIAALLCHLPKLIELQRQDFELAPKLPAAVQHGLTVLKVFDDLLAATRQADKFLGRTGPKLRIAPWFSDALWIAVWLRALGEKSGAEVGLTKAESPGVQVIKRALKRACPADRVTASAIAQNMHRHKDMIEPWKPRDEV
jgi:hypothetical protein